MSQQISASAIQQPQKLRKKFCFATIPLLAVIGIYFLHAFFITRHLIWDIGNSGLKSILISFFEVSCSYSFFIAALFITVLLFAKKNNFLLGIPMLMFSAGSLLELVLPFFNRFYLMHIAFYIIFYFLKTLAFLAVAIYTFIVTAKKKPTHKAICIIPIVIFLLFYTPFLFIPHGMIYLIADICLLIAVIILLIWVTSPYKKNKAAKTAEVQPAPAVAPVPRPVQPAVEPTAAEEKPAVAPIIPEFVAAPVQPVVEAKTEENPERTLDYSNAEEFYPPVNVPTEKPEVKAEPEQKTKPEIQSEVEKQQAVMKLLTEYKKLLDSGVITQEDYDKKKNELLGL